jgi:hypothetical protein
VADKKIIIDPSAMLRLNGISHNAIAIEIALNLADQFHLRLNLVFPFDERLFVIILLFSITAGMIHNEGCLQ